MPAPHPDRRLEYSRRVLNWVFGPKWPSPMQARLVRLLEHVLRLIPGAPEAVSRVAIKYYGEATPPRPQPFSMVSDFTSWKSLTDRTYTGRHLQAETRERTTPLIEEIDELFKRTSFQEATDTTVTFAFFAQWFTDSFLRTDRTDRKKNTSNHCIDLCQLYGLNAEKTDLLRADSGGLMKVQTIGGADFPPALMEAGTSTIKAEFAKLYSDAERNEILAICADGNEKDLFAVGLERGNSTLGHATFTTLFLREHNRIANELTVANGWNPVDDNDRIFETTRNVLIVLLLKLVVEEYVQHIGARDLPLVMPSFVADTAHWNRQNWISIEFNLLYRWHSLVPDTVVVGGKEVGVDGLISNNKLLADIGITTLIREWSEQRAGKIGLHNTGRFFFDGPAAMPDIVNATTGLMREARLASYNDYRAEFNLPRLRDYTQLTRNKQVQQELEELYGDIANLEWYVGLFAEDYPPDFMMGQLMMVMVAHDAFTQALTNPLLAGEVYNEGTFTRRGLEIIENETRMSRDVGILQQLVERNRQSDASEPYASFTSRTPGRS